MATSGSMLTRHAPQDQHFFFHKLLSVSMPSSVRLCPTIPRRETSKAANINTAKPRATARPPADIVILPVHSRQLKAIPGANPLAQTAQSAAVIRQEQQVLTVKGLEDVNQIITWTHQQYTSAVQGKPTVEVCVFNGYAVRAPTTRGKNPLSKVGISTTSTMHGPDGPATCTRPNPTKCILEHHHATFSHMAQCIQARSIGWRRCRPGRHSVGSTAECRGSW